MKCMASGFFFALLKTTLQQTLAKKAIGTAVIMQTKRKLEHFDPYLILKILKLLSAYLP